MAKWVCIVVLWVAKWVCIVTTAITIPICLLFEWIIVPFVMTILFGILAPFAVAIDAVCQKCNAFPWVKEHFWLPGKIEFVSRKEIPGKSGLYEYVFLCHCPRKKDVEVSVVAANDDEAAAKAKDACKHACG